MPKSLSDFREEIAAVVQLCEDAADGPDLVPLFKKLAPECTPLKPAGLNAQIDTLTTNAANHADALRIQILHAGGKPPFLAALRAFRNALGILAAQIEGEQRR